MIDSEAQRDIVYTEGYTDDICLLTVGKFPNMTSGLMQWTFHTVEIWCGKVGVWRCYNELYLVQISRLWVHLGTIKHNTSLPATSALTSLVTLLLN